MNTEEALVYGKEQLEIFGGEHREFIKLAIKAIEQQPKTGHWIEHPHEAGESWEYSKYECSECHVWEDWDSCFCPNCGCRMVEPQESEGEE